jgi:alanine dehydrogenase
MLIGVRKEIKVREYRIGLVPASEHELTEMGHEVVVETGAGARIAMTDAVYEAAGARIAKHANEVSAAAEMVVKVEEPQAAERKQLHPGQCRARPNLR